MELSFQSTCMCCRSSGGLKSSILACPKEAGNEGKLVIHASFGGECPVGRGVNRRGDEWPAWPGTSWGSWTEKKGTERPVWQKRCDLPFYVANYFILNGVELVKIFHWENFFLQIMWFCLICRKLLLLLKKKALKHRFGIENTETWAI